MDESLFIDLVDVEWCVRAAARGYLFFTASKAAMTHKLGVSSIRLRGKQYAMHEPERGYYFMRNAVLLIKRSTLNARWRSYFLRRIAGDTVLFGLFGDRRFKRVSELLRGLVAGLRGHSGPRLNEPLSSRSKGESRTVSLLTSTKAR
jgi:rhamnosyltransferase